MVEDRTTADGIKPSESPNISIGDKSSRIGIIWTTLFVSVVILLFLLIFILQNSDMVRIHYLGTSGMVSFGAAMLLAAAIGSILTLLIGSARILQLKFIDKQK
jgi:putative membrane protein